MYKHKLTEHPNEEVKFKFEVTDRFKDALTRQTNEAVRIASRKNTELLNSKSEFNHLPTARIMVEKVKTQEIRITKSALPQLVRTQTKKNVSFWYRKSNFIVKRWPIPQK